MKLLICLLTISIIQDCNLFTKDEKLLAEHKKSNGEKVGIYYVGLGATTRDVIQVRKSNDDKPIKIFEKYNCLTSSRLINDTSLQLVLTDTGYHNHNNRLDTILVNVK